jgi:hypothetical protein
MRFDYFLGSIRRVTRASSLAAAAAAATLLVAACGGGGGGDSSTAPPTPVATTISGTVQSTAGQPVAGASVQAAGQKATTGADGRFSFDVAATETSTVVLVKKTGFATNAKDAPVAAGNTTDITIKLFADQVSTTFSAASGTTLAPNGATVVIPANAIQTAAGAAYTGTVTVGASYYNPDTIEGVQAFAAPYQGLEAGARAPLITVGVIEVKLLDAGGNPLQLKAGFPATLTYPPSSTSAGAATIPLWYYDEVTRVWVREGQASKQANGSYVASVAHFSQWNADFMGLSATIKGCFRNSQGNVVTRAGTVGLRGQGWMHLGSGNNADGNFTIVLVPANMPLELYSAVSPAAFAPVAIPALAPGEVRQLPCVVVTNPPATNTVVVLPPTTLFTPPATNPPPTGTVAAFAGTYNGTFAGAETGTFNVVISSAGVITGQTNSTTTGQASATGSVSSTGAVSLTATQGTAGAASFTGSISATGAVSGTWRYTGAPTNAGTFAGQRV